MGIDLGGTKTEILVLDSAGVEIFRERRPTRRDDGYSALVSFITTFVTDVEKTVDQRCHIGIGMPGSISASSGLVRNANTVCLNGKPFEADLRSALARDIRLTNDANCFALAEAVSGAGAQQRVVFGVIIGTGVGGGIVIDRQVLGGRLGIAGEWGHNPLVIAEDNATFGAPRACYCGRNGCVETWLSGPGFSADFAANGGGAGLKAQTIVELADSGDTAASAALERYGERLARALANVVNLLDPDIIVLGGGMSNIRGLADTVRTQMARHVFSDIFDTPIAAAERGDSAGVYGAAWLWPAPELST